MPANSVTAYVVSERSSVIVPKVCFAYGCQSFDPSETNSRNARAFALGVFLQHGQHLVLATLHFSERIEEVCVVLGYTRIHKYTVVLGAVELLEHERWVK